ncbi:hypothetical protein K488DRAFT_85705 [Vararia minispora EC-137]|uniref:Uncharacterized protein n=1 Tax=Vararia minispora EC-137 TaxID=1314806 RepID=A0ACB8QL59_9AGAM|nr:hypothetical protein K488DRAFT_85705 [Vararia minispora EC-137]
MGETQNVSPPNLPPKKSKSDRGVRKDVRPPFARVSLTTFLNLLAAGLLAVLAWYIYHATSLALGMVRDSQPGSMNPFWPLGFSFGSKSHIGSGSRKKGDGMDESMVEVRIAALAEELGMGKDSDLAVAIAEAVREYVPPASLSALSARAQETGGSRIINALRNEDQEGEESRAGSVRETLGKVVGMDDTPGADLD